YSLYKQNGNNEIDLKEASNLFTDLGFNFNNEELEAIYLYLDNDGSLTIGFDEFLHCWEALATRKSILRGENLKLLVTACKLFKTFDKDNSKKLSLDEFKVFHEKLCTKYEDLDPFEELIKSLDKDGDAKINFREFIMCLNWFSV
ncbi:predicted protein, partial [Naegleria gruberi]